MRIRLLALILAAAGALVFFGLTLTAAAGNTPQSAVTRLLQPHSAADLCGSIVPANRHYGPGGCVGAFYRWRTNAQNLVISHVVIRGENATLQANYDYGPGNPVETHYHLAHEHGVWLITGTFIPVTVRPSR
jgi:hypothetical protein